MEKIDWKILLSMNDDKTFNVTLLPIPKVKDQALKEMAPIILKNVTMEQLDSINSETLDGALTKVQSLVSNVADFEKAAEKSEELTKMVKDKREKAKKKKEKDEKDAEDAAPGMFAKPDKEKTPKEVEEAVTDAVEGEEALAIEELTEEVSLDI